jgi:cell division protein FtsW
VTGKTGDTTGGRAEPETTAPADRALVNPFAVLSGLLARPMTSYYLLLACTALLLGIGLLMVLSASSIDSYVDSGSAFTVFNNQLLYALVGIPALWLGLRLPPAAYRRLGYPLLVISVALLAVIAFVPQLGSTAWGSTRWIDLGPVTVQPSEPAKLALALWGAALLARRGDRLIRWKQLLVPLFPVAAVLLALVGHEDLGTMLCLLLVLLALLWVAGVRFRAFAVMVLAGLGAVTLLILAEPYRLQRLVSFRDPFADPTDTGHQAVQGLYSLSTGGLWGVGLGESRGKWEYLPNSHNDFIFAIIGEELGLIGCLVVLALFAVLGYAGLRVAARVTDPFVRLVAAACTAWLVGQAAINVAAVIGLVPITGIPLPLISAGGSSLVLTMFVLGMLASFARTEPAAARALRARGRTRWSRLIGVPLPREGVERRRTVSRASPNASVPARSVAAKTVSNKSPTDSDRSRTRSPVRRPTRSRSAR